MGPVNMLVDIVQLNFLTFQRVLSHVQDYTFGFVGEKKTNLAEIKK